MTAQKLSLFITLLAIAFATHVAPSRFAFAQPPAAERGEPQDPAEPAEPPAPTTQRIEAALQKRVDLDFFDQPLSDVARFFADSYNIPVMIDRPALEAVGLSTDSPVTIAIDDVRLSSALNHVLRDLELTWTIRDGVLQITTREEDEEALVNRVYPVQQMLSADQPVDADQLIGVLTSIIQPEMWGTVGGPASLEWYRGRLIVSAPYRMQLEIRQLLAALEEVQKQFAADPAKVTHELVSLEPARNQEIRQALERNVPLQFLDVPLSDVAGYLSNVLQVPVLIEHRALNAIGLSDDTAVTVELAESSAANGLRLILRPLGLAATVVDEAVLITSPEEAEERLTVRLYPVYDLFPAAADTEARSHYLDQLHSVIGTTVAPESWDSVGGPASLEIWAPAGTLLIAQTDDVHQEISRLLGELRATGGDTAESSDAVRAPMTLHVYHLYTAASANEIQKLVRTVTTPEVWEEKGAQLQSVNGALIVRHTSRVHREVQDLLRKLTPPAPGGMGGGGTGGGGGLGGMGGGMF